MSHVARSLVVVITLALCTAAAALAAGQDTERTFEAIRYSDSGGFSGGGTGMSLSLSGAGKVEAQARGREVVVMQLQPQELVELRAAIAAVDWVHIAQRFATPGAADLVVRDLTIYVGGSKYEIHADSLAKLPAGLRTIFDRLDALYRRASAGPARGESDAIGWLRSRCPTGQTNATKPQSSQSSRRAMVASGAPHRAPSADIHSASRRSRGFAPRVLNRSAVSMPVCNT